MGPGDLPQYLRKRKAWAKDHAMSRQRHATKAGFVEVSGPETCTVSLCPPQAEPCQHSP